MKADAKRLSEVRPAHVVRSSPSSSTFERQFLMDVLTVTADARPGTPGHHPRLALTRSASGSNHDEGLREGRSPSMSKHTPYIPDRVPKVARPHLPGDADSELTAADVRAFVSQTRRRPAVRMQVLAVLRAHAANGAETPTALIALCMAVFGSVAATLVAIGSEHAWTAWAAAVGTLLLVMLSRSVIVALHARRMTALVWLAAYKDSLERYERDPLARFADAFDARQ